MPALSFSPCGRRCRREAVTDEGGNAVVDVESYLSSDPASQAHLLPQGEKDFACPPEMSGARGKGGHGPLAPSSNGPGSPLRCGRDDGCLS